jgi:hypothetical protein
MLTILIYIFLKKYRKQNQAGTGVHISKFLRNRMKIIFVSFIILLLLIPFLSRSQNCQLTYKIVKGGDHIGWLRLEKSVEGTKTNLSLASEIKTRFRLLSAAAGGQHTGRGTPLRA